MSELGNRFDEALDEALASYGEAPERTGLERRVLARVRERTAPSARTRSLALALCTTAAAACCLFWWQTPKAPVETRPAKMSVQTARKMESPKMQVPAPGRAISLASVTKRRRALKRSAEPKLSRFPTPYPMSSEERALLRLVRGDPKNIPSELIHVDEPIKPVQITPVEIRPL